MKGHGVKGSQEKRFEDYKNFPGSFLKNFSVDKFLEKLNWEFRNEKFSIVEKKARDILVVPKIL